MLDASVVNVGGKRQVALSTYIIKVILHYFVQLEFVLALRVDQLIAYEISSDRDNCSLNLALAITLQM